MNSPIDQINTPSDIKRERFKILNLILLFLMILTVVFICYTLQEYFKDINPMVPKILMLYNNHYNVNIAIIFTLSTLISLPFTLTGQHKISFYFSSLIVVLAIGSSYFFFFDGVYTLLSRLIQ